MTVTASDVITKEVGGKKSSENEIKKMKSVNESKLMKK